MPAAAIEPVIDVLDAHEKLHIDQVIAKFQDHPGALLGILEAVQSANPHKYLSMALAALHRRGDRAFRRQESTARPHFSRCSTWIRRAITWSASAAARRAIRAARATCWKSSAWTSGWAGTRPTRQRGRQAVTDHTRPQVYDPHRGLLRAVRAGAGGRSQSPHPQPCERAHAAAGSQSTDAGEEMMPRIQDIGASTRFAKSGLGQAVATHSAHDRGHGNLRPRQRRGRAFSRPQ